LIFVKKYIFFIIIILKMKYFILSCLLLKNNPYGKEKNHKIKLTS
jgi:hypothetical protein